MSARSAGGVRHFFAPHLGGQSVTARKPRISLCMIVRNEASNLADCLQPVAHLFDELVIVDTGSTDATKDIARRFTDQVFDFPWCDDFSAARNESIRRATGDWIFWLDADDRVRPEQVARLQELFARLDHTPRVFLMNTILQPAHANKDRFLVSHARLFRRHERLRWKGRVHEQLRPEPITLGYEWVFTDVEIDHIGYQDRVHADRKGRRKLRLLRMDYALDPDDPSTLLHLAMSLGGVGALREARDKLLRLTEISEPTHPCMRRVFSALSEIAIHDGQADAAIAYARRGLQHFPHDLYLQFAEASALYSLERYGECILLLEKVIQSIPEPTLLIGAPGDVEQKLAPRMIGAAKRMQGAHDEAVAILQQVLERFPDDVSSWYNLGLVYLDQGDSKRLQSLVRHLITLPDGRMDASTLAALWHLRAGNLPTAGAVIDQLIAESPRDPLPRMLRAEWLSRSGAPLRDQLRALRDLLRLQPGNLEAQYWVQQIELAQGAPAGVSTPPTPTFTGVHHAVS